MTVETTPDYEHGIRTPPVAARLFAGTGEGPVLDPARHRQLHGPLRASDRQTLVEATAHVGLLGRGGAAFPVSRKLESTRPGSRAEVVVNLSEGEPASHKDRVLAASAPHLVLDGALLVAGALRTRRITVAVHDATTRDAVAAAVRTRSDAAHVEVVQASGGFVSGEVRALLKGLEGAPAAPPGRRQIPSVSGLHGHPTFVSNAETFGHLGLLGTHGREWYGEVGGPAERGTTLLTLLGRTVAPGVVEAPMGMPLRDLLDGPTGPVLIGGYHGTWLSEVGDLTLDRAGLRGRGLHLGAGVIAALPTDTCSLAEVAAVAEWLGRQSLGQCGPCFFGLPSVAADVDALLRGQLPQGGLQALRRRLAQLPGRGACAHPDGAAMFVRSALEVLQSEVAEHLARGTCGRPYAGTLPVDRSAA